MADLSLVSTSAPAPWKPGIDKRNRKKKNEKEVGSSAPVKKKEKGKPLASVGSPAKGWLTTHYKKMQASLWLCSFVHVSFFPTFKRP